MMSSTAVTVEVVAVLALVHWLCRTLALIPLLALAATVWVLIQGPNAELGFGSRTNVLTGQDPEVRMLGWHVIGWGVVASVTALWLIHVLAPLAKLHIVRSEYRRLIENGVPEHQARVIADEAAWDYGR